MQVLEYLQWGTSFFNIIANKCHILLDAALILIIQVSCVELMWGGVGWHLLKGCAYLSKYSKLGARL